MTKTWSLALLAALAVFATALPAIEVGDSGPDFKFDKSWNALEGATKLSDYRERVVLLEVWATWWGPCVKGVPHLIELNNKFRERGFEIVAVSDEDAGTIEKFVKDKGINYGIIKASNVLKTYGGTGYPSAWVLDVEGKVIWKGHPAGLTDVMVEDWVKDLAPVKITKEVHKVLKNAVEAYNKGEFGKAESEVDKYLSSDDPVVKADAEFVDGVIEKRRAVGEAKAAKARDLGDLPKLAKLLEAEAKAFDGSEHGKKCAEEAKSIQASKEFKDCVKAQSELDKLKPKINDMKAEKAKKALEKIARDFPNTPAGKEAAELAKDF